MLMSACKAIFIGTVAFGAINSSTLIWTMADVGVGTMAWLNLIAIMLLQKPAFIALKDYERQLKDGLNPVFHPEQLGIANATYWEGNRAEDNLAVEEESGVDNLTGLDPRTRFEFEADAFVLIFSRWLSDFSHERHPSLCSNEQ